MELFLQTFPELWKVESLGRKGWQWLGFYRPRLGSNGGGYVYDLKRGRSRQFQTLATSELCSCSCPRRVAPEWGLVSKFHSHWSLFWGSFSAMLTKMKTKPKYQCNQERYLAMSHFGDFSLPDSCSPRLVAPKWGLVSNYSRTFLSHFGAFSPPCPKTCCTLPPEWGLV